MTSPGKHKHRGGKRRKGRMASRPFPADVPVQVETVDNPVDYLRWTSGAGEPSEIPFGELHPPLFPPSPELTAASRAVGSQAGRMMHSVRRCLAPRCEKTGHDIIKAHAISKAMVLKSLAVDGHVWAPHEEMFIGEDGGYQMESPFKSVGINQATTFTGLCEEHDNTLFYLIDNNEADPDSEEYLFKLAYRAILRDAYEQHCILDNLDHIASAHFTAADDPIDPFTFMHQTSCQSLACKNVVDKMLTAGHWAGLRHKVFHLPQAKPYVAVAALMYLDDRDRGTERSAAFSIVPFKSGILAVFSSTKADYLFLESYLERHLSAPPTSRRFLCELTATVLRDTKTFVISPKLWSKLSRDRQAQAADFYLASRMNFPGRRFPHRFICFFA